MDKPKILVVDDDEPIRTQMKWALIHDYDVYLAVDTHTAEDILQREHPPLVILDLGLPPHPDDLGEGLKLLGKIIHQEPSAKVIVVTGHPDKSAALEAIAMGAHDFLTKPIDIEELKFILKRAHYVRTIEDEYRALQEKLNMPAFSEIIGSSRVMEEIFSTVRKVATTDVPVFITGDSGTGKELLALAIHSNSIRREKPFIPINCGAIPGNLLESELFGHEKGAFTGAHVQRRGRLELADGGTIFLDEIAELPLQLQVKILRFLQDFNIERVGGREVLNLDVRVVAATNRDIKRLISEGGFREDLYYRLSVISIELPPLRKRREDIMLLAVSFLQKFAHRGTMPKKLSREAAEALTLYNWPGNIRELENRIRRAITLVEGPVIKPSDLGLGSAAGSTGSLSLKKAREELDKKMIGRAIISNNGNISKAAEDLGITRPTLHHLIKKYKINKTALKGV